MNAIVDWLLRDIRTGKEVAEMGLALIIEAGNRNNPELMIAFENIRIEHSLDGILRSVGAVDKKSCRAIQVADLLAFYSRREGNRMFIAKSAGAAPPEQEQMLKIITERGQFRGFVATDFGPNAGASFFADAARPPALE